MRLKTILTEMMKGQFDKAKPKTPGRRYIPDVVSFDKNKIDQLNKETGGPHIQLINAPKSSYERMGIGEPKEGISLVRMLVSPLLYTAISQTQRGRSSRDLEVAKAPLLRRYQEIFEKEQTLKSFLKKSLEQATMQKTSKGEFYLTREIMPIFYAKEQNLVIMVLKAKTDSDKIDTIREEATDPKALAQQFLSIVDKDEINNPQETLKNFFTQYYNNYTGSPDEQEFFINVIELDPGYLTPSDIAKVTGRDDEFFAKLQDEDIQGNPKYKGWNLYVSNEKFDNLEFGRDDNEDLMESWIKRSFKFRAGIIK